MPSFATDSAGETERDVNSGVDEGESACAPKTSRVQVDSTDGTTDGDEDASDGSTAAVTELLPTAAETTKTTCDVVSTAGLRIGLFGSSLNPPTQGGHRSIVKYFAKHFDQVWILPVYQHAYASKRGLAPYEQRLAMSRLAFSGIPNAQVRDDERQLFLHHNETQQQQDIDEVNATATAPKLGTFHLINFLKKQNPGTTFSLILGGDTYTDLRGGKWKNGEELQELVTLDVINRVGFPPITDVASTTTLHTIPGITDASSTAARACSDIQALELLVGPLVAGYISQHKLYTYSDANVDQ